MLFKNKGFTQTVFAFGIAEATINSFSTYMNYMLQPEGFSLSFVSYMGSAFILAAMAGSGIIGYLVDKYHSYKFLMLLCFAGCIAGLVGFSILSDDRVIGTANAPMGPVIVAIISIGGFIGPLQPIAIEVAVECTYPAHESAITALQQLAGNLFSSILTPILSAIRDPNTDSFVVPNWVLSALVALSAAFYFTFNGEYRRMKIDMHGARGTEYQIIEEPVGVSINQGSTSGLLSPVSPNVDSSSLRNHLLNGKEGDNETENAHMEQVGRRHHIPSETEQDGEMEGNHSQGRIYDTNEPSNDENNS